MARVTLQPSRARIWVLGLGASTSAILAMAMLLGTPTTVSAADLVALTQKSDGMTRHIATYEKQQDGSLVRIQEMFLQGGQVRYIDKTGTQYTYRNGRTSMLFVNGSLTVEDKRHNEMFAFPSTTKDLIGSSGGGQGFRLAVKHGVDWQGNKVDRYTRDVDFSDDQGSKIHNHMDLYVDPVKDLPLEAQSATTGFPLTIMKWDYPIPDSQLCELPITPKTRYYDLDIQRASVRRALNTDGQVAMVGGQRVELLQAMVDDTGQACAIVEANYAYPVNYGVRIDGVKPSSESAKDPFTTGFANRQPVKFNNKMVQLIYTPVGQSANPVNFSDHLTIEVPVFKDGKLLGYAKFTDVPVMRTWSLRYLLEPENAPFWVAVWHKVNNVSQPAQATSDK